MEFKIRTCELQAPCFNHHFPLSGWLKYRVGLSLQDRHKTKDRKLVKRMTEICSFARVCSGFGLLLKHSFMHSLCWKAVKANHGNKIVLYFFLLNSVLIHYYLSFTIFNGKLLNILGWSWGCCLWLRSWLGLSSLTSLLLRTWCLLSILLLFFSLNEKKKRT